MGFDTVMVACPVCGQRVSFNSHSGDCVSAVYDLEDAPDDVMYDVNLHFNHTCSGCGSVFRVSKGISVSDN
jgi:rubredoxin